MASITVNPDASKSKVASLENVKGESPWADSFRRLRRNRMAIVGIIIIVLNILAAIFAPLLAPRDYRRQVLEDNNAAPQWVIDLFPTMRPRDENFRIPADATVLVETGDRVSAGDPLIQDAEGNVLEVANMSATVVLQGGQVSLTQFDITTISLTADQTAAVQDQMPVNEGQVVVSGPNGDILAPYRGTAVVTDEQVIVRERSSGYVKVANEYPLGADGLGRDMLSRLLYGARISLAVAFVGPLVALLVGLTLGLISGYFGGRVDSFIMRIADIFYAFPSLLLIILLMAYFRAIPLEEFVPGSFQFAIFQLDQSMGGMLFIFIGIGFTSWMALARLTRGQVLSVREKDFILSARSLGVPRRTIMWRHVLPNILGPVIVAETLTIPTYIRYEAFLSFIGLGVQPPTPSWGGMISEGTRALVAYPFQVIFPALALFFIMFAFNFLGDGLRDALDPRMRGVD